eukprot:GHVP01033831.1.p1 GENE.GHVP01033831.1~~GHVP01033831.1.p1  ORF type:complete len:104 (+),score=22.73 GHVP01033831.1:266-577(+)
MSIETPACSKILTNFDVVDVFVVSSKELLPSVRGFLIFIPVSKSDSSTKSAIADATMSTTGNSGFFGDSTFFSGDTSLEGIFLFRFLSSEEPTSSSLPHIRIK